MFQDDQDDVRIKECEQEFFEMVSERYTRPQCQQKLLTVGRRQPRAARCRGVLMSNLRAQVGSSMQKAEEASE
jgi:hypothetical protein